MMTTMKKNAVSFSMICGLVLLMVLQTKIPKFDALYILIAYFLGQLQQITTAKF